MDFTQPTEEELAPYAWGRLVELGMATEAFEKIMDPQQEDEVKAYTELAVSEAAYASRSWWQKLSDCF